VETLGQRLKYYREQIGLSQIDLSEKSTISQASIARIESGKQKNLKRETMRKLADGLGISLTQLMDPVTVVREEEAVYISAKAVPVLGIKDIDVMKDLGVSVRKADTFEPSLSSDKKCLGKIYFPYGNLLIQPLDHDLPPIMHRKKEKSRRAIRTLRVSGI